MKILFKYPTYKRPDWFKFTLEKYISMLSNKYDYEFRITLNTDDCTMNCDAMKSYMNSKPNLKYFYGKHKTKIEAVNADMNDVEFDILVLVSDDMIPQMKGFDVLIVEAMLEHFPDMDGALHFDDGLYGGDRTITLSIMGSKLYKQLGHIYHPAYKSFYCDNEFTDIVQQINKVVFIPKIPIKHEWRGYCGNIADEVYKRNSLLGKPDEATYKKRKAAGFPK